MRLDLLPKTFEGKLDRLNEECAEVIIAVSKLKKHGPEATDEKTGIRYDNVENLRSELIDVIHAATQVMEML